MVFFFVVRTGIRCGYNLDELKSRGVCYGDLKNFIDLYPILHPTIKVECAFQIATRNACSLLGKKKPPNF